MKLAYNYFSMFFSVLLILGTLPALAQPSDAIPNTAVEVSFYFAPPGPDKVIDPVTNPRLTDGSVAYGNNIWTNDLYSFDTDDPTTANEIGKMTMQTASGDFHPNEPDFMYVMDINTNYMGKVDVSSGEIVDSVLVPVPVGGGIWTVLSIHKTLGVFYGVATNGSVSDVYEIDPETGATTLVFNTGLNLVISGTFDGNGMFWFLEIPNSEIYKFDLANLELELVGPAGFIANFAQGMAYDPGQDEVYLAAYEDVVGPQLRLLNRVSGEATYIADLPGSTTAFGFPGAVPIQQIINIPAGWSGISSYVTPDNPNLTNVLANISDEFTLLQNDQGNFYWPAQGINTLQVWDPSQGYLISMQQESLLTIEGAFIEDPGVFIDEGWSYVPVLVPEPYPADQLFNGVDGFVMVKEIAGPGVFWPEYNINTLGNLMPGHAYNAYSSQAGETTYEIIPDEKSSQQEQIKNRIPETPWNPVSFVPNSHMVVFNKVGSDLEKGDIIGAFTPNNWCAGAAEVSDPEMNVAMAVNAADPSDDASAGFESGETILYKLYRPSTNEILELTPVYDTQMNSGSFSPNGMSLVTSVNLSVTGLTSPETTKAILYPNPSKGSFTVKSYHENIKLVVFNAFGETIFEESNAGTFNVDLENQPKGTYFVKLQTETGTRIEKVVLY